MIRRLAPFLLSALLGLGASASAAQAASSVPAPTDQAPTARGGIIAIFDLNRVSGEVMGQPSLEDVMSGAAFNEKRLSYFDLISRLRLCKDSKRVQAVVIYLRGHQLGGAQITELGRRLQEIRASGKDVVFWADGLRGSDLTLASAGRIVLMPDAEVEYAGAVVQYMHFKGLLDKIGVRFDVIHCGDFKSAFENFYLDAPSAPARRQSEALYGALFGQAAEELAGRRQLPWSRIEEIVSQGLMSARQAQELGLVDSLSSHQDFVQDLRKRHPGAQINRDYGAPKKKEVKLDSLPVLMNFIASIGQPKPEDPRPALALVNLNGNIEDDMAEQLRAHLVRCARDPRIKGVVLRIDSPGGSALASEAICSGTETFKKTGKPFVVSMGNVAASGGYYAAVYGQPVYAESSTITGSIGVVGGKPVIKGLMDKLGIQIHTWKLGDRADLMAIDKSFAEGDEAFLRGIFNRVYGRFKERVLDGRSGKISPARIEDLAGGRVYTGTQALELGLVDKLGGLREALTDATTQAKLAGDYRIDLFPAQMSMMDLLTAAPQDDDDDRNWLSADARQTLADHPELLRELALLQRLQPQLARRLAAALDQALALSRGQAMLVAPPFVQ